MKKILALLIGLTFGSYALPQHVMVLAPANATVPPKSVVILPNSEGGFYSRDPEGEPPEEVPLSFNGLAALLTNSGINNQIVGTAYSQNICSTIFGTERDVCVLAIVPKTGDDPVTEGWSVEADCGGDDEALLTHNGGETGAGTMALSCTGANSAAESLTFAWSYAADETPDEGYQFPMGDPVGVSNFILDAVATFNNISLYWKQPGNNGANQALCRFREKGTNPWIEAMPLWFDNREPLAYTGTAPNQKQVPRTIPAEWSNQFRGSILGVLPDKTYQVECMTETSKILASTEIDTWQETPPETVTDMSGTSTGHLNITVGGTATNWKTYRATTANGWIIDRNNNGDGVGPGLSHCITVNAPYVIIDDVRCTDFQNGGVFLGPLAHHVRIQNSEFDDFGVDDPNSIYGCNGSSALLTANAKHPNMKAIVFQNNYVHDPKVDANAWGEPARPTSDNCFSPGTNHPAGSSATDVHDTGGNFVYRYNTIGDRNDNFNFMFDDGWSGGQNFSYLGDCPRDCDYYGNFATHIWDDAMQNEGAGINNRSYENYIQNSLTCFGNAPIAIGPYYMFRNVCTKGIRGPAEIGGVGLLFKLRTKPDDCPDGGTPALNPTVCGNGLVTIGHGRVLLTHNTVYKTGSTDSRAQTMQLDDGSLRDVEATCNVFDTGSSMGSTNRGWWQDAENELRGILEDNLWGAGQTKPSADATGTVATPTYQAGGTAFTSSFFQPALTSPATDACDFRYPTLNTTYSGTKPDRGAVERGQTNVIYGIR